MLSWPADYIRGRQWRGGSACDGAPRRYDVRMMLPMLIALAAMTPAEPAAPDDPAVEVCAMLVRESLRRPDTYAASGSPAFGAGEVTLAYTSLDPHGRRTDGRTTCRFHLAAQDGRFHLEPLRNDYLAARMTAARARLAHRPSARDELMIRSEMMDISRELYVQGERLGRAERRASATGLYPIAPGRTALRAR